MFFSVSFVAGAMIVVEIGLGRGPPTENEGCADDVCVMVWRGKRLEDERARS
jgi:hypothetical protein